MTGAKAQFKKGQKVFWKWAGGVIEGAVEEVYFVSVTKEIKGKKITRHGSIEKPAYLVRSVAGNLALKLVTELYAKDPHAVTGSRSVAKRKVITSLD